MVVAMHRITMASAPGRVVVLAIACCLLLCIESCGARDAHQQQLGQQHQQRQGSQVQHNTKHTAVATHSTSLGAGSGAQSASKQQQQQQQQQVRFKKVIRRRVVYRKSPMAAHKADVVNANANANQAPVLLERAAVEVGTRVMTSAAAEHQTAAEAALAAMGTIAVSADADAEQELVLKDPGVQAALAARTPDAVDKLIQGILDGTGQGGVVTSEFNKDNVHATIISNVNELRITQVENDAEEKNKAAAESDRKNAIVTRANQASQAASSSMFGSDSGGGSASGSRSGGSSSPSRSSSSGPSSGSSRGSGSASISSGKR